MAMLRSDRGRAGSASPSSRGRAVREHSCGKACLRSAAKIPSMSKEEGLIRTLYAAFNARDFETLLSSLHPEVDWPNGMEGGRVHRREGVREYWTRQWSMVNSTVEPLSVRVDEDGRIAVEVHQMVRDLAGAVLLDQKVRHVYELEDGLIKRMEINP